MTGVWTAKRDSGLSSLGISAAELNHVIPSDLPRVGRVSLYEEVLPATAFAVDRDRAIVADLAADSLVTSIWIIHQAPNPTWMRAALIALGGRWAFLLDDVAWDFQFPLTDTASLDQWLEAIRTK